MTKIEFERWANTYSSGGKTWWCEAAQCWMIKANDCTELLKFSQQIALEACDTIKCDECVDGIPCPQKIKRDIQVQYM